MRVGASPSERRCEVTERATPADVRFGRVLKCAFGHAPSANLVASDGTRYVGCGRCHTNVESHVRPYRAREGNER